MDTSWWEWRRSASAVGAALLVVGAVAGAQLAVGAVLDAGAAGAARPALSPYREGGFTVRAAAVDRRVDIASAEDGSWALGHTPAGGDVVLDLDLLSGDAVRPWWVDPAAGTTMELAELASSGVARFTVPPGGVQAWVLVVDDAAAGYGRPDLDDVRAAIGSRDGGSGAGSESGGEEGRQGAPGDTSDAASGSGGGDRAGDGPASGTEPGDRRFIGGGGDGGGGSGGGGSGGDEGGADGGQDSGGQDGAGQDGAGQDGADSGEDGAADSGEDGAAGGEPEGGGEAGGGPASGTEPEDRRFTGDGGAGGGDGGSTPEKPAAPAPAPPAPAKPPAPEKPAGGSWDALAECESSGDWSISTGNGYYGGLQFDKGTWSDFGGTEYAPTADGASKEQQIEIAEKVRDARGGYGSWPACASKLGLPK